MPQYSTGEVAKACNVSVRTVQFYDAKNLLNPSGLSEGGRRLYSDGDLERMRLICMLKSLGLTLSSIKGILESENKLQVLDLLLSELAKQIGGDIGEKQRQLNAIKAIQSGIREAGALPVHSISDIEQIMKSQTKLRKTHGAMLAVGILMDVIQLGTVLLWIFKGIWWPFAAGMPAVILMGILITVMYHRNVAYICPNCSVSFKPLMRKLLFSRQTAKTLLLTCPGCGQTGYCVAVGAKR